MQKLEIQILEGSLAPRYGKETICLEVDKAVITESGMESGAPIVDIQMHDDKTGKKYFIMLTGCLVEGLAGAVKGVRERNGL